MALLALCHAARPGFVAAATVDHGLRQASLGEAEQVAHECATLGIPHEILNVTISSGNVQQEARKARYAALESWMERREIDCLATAHHVDDQAETFLMRLNRGSGVAGLAGVRRTATVPGGSKRLIRPLLSWRKEELVEIARSAGLQYCTDPSNADPTFDRARMRGILENTNWLNIDAIAQSAGYLAEADTAVDWIVQQEWKERVRRIGKRYVYRPDAPRVVRLRIINKLLLSIAGKEPRGSSIAGLIDRLEQGEGGNIGGVLITIVGDAWRFEKEPPRAGHSD